MINNMGETSGLRAEIESDFQTFRLQISREDDLGYGRQFNSDENSKTPRDPSPPSDRDDV